MEANSKDKISILLVDDRPENLLSLENLIKCDELNIVKANSGNEALGLMLRHDFALVLLDVQMPEMDGFEVANLMRSSNRTRHIPIIFITAINKEPRHVYKGYKSGAVDYLFKPLNPEVLRSKVNVFIELHRKQKEIEHSKNQCNTALIGLKKSETILRRRDILLSGANKAADCLLKATCCADGVSSALSFIGKAADVDRVFIYERQSQDSFYCLPSLCFEWIRDERFYLSNPNDHFFQDKMDNDWMERLEKGEHIFGTIDTFSAENMIMLKRLNIRSILIIPIFVENRLWGMIDFEDCQQTYKWSDSEISILASATRNIGHTIMKFQIADIREASRLELEEKNREMRQAIQLSGQMAIQMDEANRSRGEFLANVSHEIRTPLTGIIGMTSLLMDTSISDEQRQYLKLTYQSAESLLDVINDILDFSKLEARQMELDYLNFDLLHTIEEIIDMLAIKAHESKLNFDCLFAPSCPRYLFGDPVKVRQILINLIGNAIKFTEKGSVFVNIYSKDPLSQQAALVFDVIDTGIGIPENQKEILFKSFTQLDGSSTRKYGGTGLGLAISKELSEIMGGIIHVESEPGVGSCFSLSLTFEKQFQEPSAEKKQFNNLHVLVFEPQQNCQRVLFEYLNELGCQSGIAASFEEAQKMIQEARLIENDYNATIINIDTDLSHAKKFLTMIKNSFPEIKIILMPKLGQPQTKFRIDGIEADGLLHRPIKWTSLHTLFEKLFRDSNAETQIKEKKDNTNIKSTDNPDSLKILLAEDNHVNQLAARSLLERVGYLVTTVNNGKEAIDCLTTQEFDIVFMDIQMPVMDGIEAATKIRDPNQSRVLNPDIPIIALTAHSKKDYRETCIKAGMNGFVVKPFRQIDFIEKIEKYKSDRKVKAQNKIQNEILNQQDAFNKPPLKFDELLYRMEGDSELCCELLNSFQKDMTKYLHRMQQYIQENSIDKILKDAHALKSSSSVVDACQVYSITKQIEEDIMADKKDTLDTHFKNLETACVNFEKACNQTIQTKTGENNGSK